MKNAAKIAGLVVVVVDRMLARRPWALLFLLAVLAMLGSCLVRIC